MVNRAAEPVEREVFDPMVGEDFFEQRHQPLTEGLRKFLCHKAIGQIPVFFCQPDSWRPDGKSFTTFFMFLAKPFLCGGRKTYNGGMKLAGLMTASGAPKGCFGPEDGN